MQNYIQLQRECRSELGLQNGEPLVPTRFILWLVDKVQKLQQTPVSGSLPLDRIIVYLECLHSYLSSEETFDFANDTCLNEADDLQTFINSLRQISR